MRPRQPRGTRKGEQFAAVYHPETDVDLGRSPDKTSLPLIEEDVLDILHGLASSELGDRFYLAGGTGLALQIAHRRSNDLDYFIDAERLERRSIWKGLRRAGVTKYEVILNEPEQVDLAVGERRRKLSFIAYPFPSPRPRVEVEGQACADVLEISAMKAYTLGRRGTARDYVDIEAAISRGDVSLEEIIETAKSRFVLDGEPVFSERLFLQQLVYTEDIDDAGSLEGLSTSFAGVERSLRTIVADYARRRLS